MNSPESAAAGAPPFSSLTPDRLLDALESAGLRGDGRLVALNSYENRVYLVYLDEPWPALAADGVLLESDHDDAPVPLTAGHDAQQVRPRPLSSVVVKFYRKGRWTDAQIHEEHQFVRELAAHDIPAIAAIALSGHDTSDGTAMVAARARSDAQTRADAGQLQPDAATLASAAAPRARQTLVHFEDLRFAAYRRAGGRAPELDRPEVLDWIGRFLGRIHSIGARARFAERAAITSASHGEAPRDWLLASGLIPADLQVPWQTVVDQALDVVRACYQRCGETAVLRLHGDCHAGNILWTDAGPHFVDFDDACMGPAIQDLWMLLSGDRESMSQQLDDLLKGYEQMRAFDRRELGLLEPLRTLRMIHYSAWIARRWQDPAFPAAFTWFGTDRYWQDQILALREQIALMQDEPLTLARN